MLADVIISSKKPSLPGLVDIDLGKIRQLVCGAAAYFKRAGRPKKPQDLREHACLVNTASATKGWPFRSGSRRLNVEVKGILTSNSSAVLIKMALQGYGIARVPRYAVATLLASKALNAIFEGATASPERMRAYYSKAKPLPAKTAEFISFLQASLARR